jgi:hypothetical protein
VGKGQPILQRSVSKVMKLGINLINLADVTADHQTITSHLKRTDAPFLIGWMALLHRCFDDTHDGSNKTISRSSSYS